MIAFYDRKVSINSYRKRKSAPNIFKRRFIIFKKRKFFRNQNMKLIMTLLIRDEEDILRENLLYHLEQGVDFFIATDNLSIDQSPNILRDFESQGLLFLIQEEDDTYAQAKWVTRMAQLAKTKFNADWVINSDADEFWWPASGNIKNVLSEIPKKYSVVNVPRYNFLPQADVAKQNLEFMTVRDVISKNHLGRPLPPKVCHRAIKDIRISMGNHSVKHKENLAIFPGTPLEIFHFPLRSYSHFENRISKGGSALERNTTNVTGGGTWRKLYMDLQAGKLKEYFDNQALTQDKINMGLQNNLLIIDERLKKFLQERNII